jgi:hypothetical protein
MDHIAAKAIIGSDSLPSGTWGLGPISISWSFSNYDEVDIAISILGIAVDKLTGTISPTATTLDDTVNILGIITGSLALEAKYATTDNTNGLYLTGQLSGPDFNTNALNVRILSW